jgi:hypothetical protein
MMTKDFGPRLAILILIAPLASCVDPTTSNQVFNTANPASALVIPVPNMPIIEQISEQDNLPMNEANNWVKAGYTDPTQVQSWVQAGVTNTIPPKH